MSLQAVDNGYRYLQMNVFLRVLSFFITIRIFLISFCTSCLLLVDNFFKSVFWVLNALNQQKRNQHGLSKKFVMILFFVGSVKAFENMA